MSKSIVWLVGFGDIAKRIIMNTQCNNYLFHTLSRTQKPGLGEYGKNSVHHSVDLDSNQMANVNELEDARVIYFIPPPTTGLIDSRLDNFLRQYGERINKVVLISTTGVYGDCNGEWVDEQEIPNPSTSRAHRRLDAEKRLVYWAKQYDRPYVILRVPGIYAENRLPLARLRRGDPVIRQDQAPFTNRIHADDLANVCLTVLNHNEVNLTVNVTDGHPLTMTEYFTAVADAVGLPRPPEIDLTNAEDQLSAGMLSYVKESRKIRNDKLLKIFPIILRYPNLGVTLQQIREFD